MIFRFNAHHIAVLSRYASVVVTRIALTTNNAIGRTLHFPVFSRKFLPQTQVPVSSRVLHQPHRCVHLYQRSPQVNPQCHLIPAQHQVSLLHFQVDHPSQRVPQISQPQRQVKSQASCHQFRATLPILPAIYLQWLQVSVLSEKCPSSGGCQLKSSNFNSFLPYFAKVANTKLLCLHTMLVGNGMTGTRLPLRQILTLLR